MGVRPPKDWFIGWRQCGGVFQLELKEQPGDWDVVHGPYVFAGPAFAALLRHAWLELHPGASPAALPSRLLNGNPPARWELPVDAGVQSWLAELNAFLSGRDTRLPTVDPLQAMVLAGEASEPTSPLPFDDQWRAMDAACLADFYARIPVPAGYWPSSSSQPSPTAPSAVMGGAARPGTTL
jgi:hypothetical protein